uniref:Uncharacterized protein n=1 Tax=Romanomermis culicivorax TaxID=13658 RepID=A0A915L1K8_ROMCU
MKAAKLLLVYVTISTNNFESNGEWFGTILQVDNGLDAFSIAEKSIKDLNAIKALYAIKAQNAIKALNAKYD